VISYKTTVHLSAGHCLWEHVVVNILRISGIPL